MKEKMGLNRVNREPFMFLFCNKRTRLCKLMLINFDDIKSAQSLATTEKSSLALALLGLTLLVIFSPYSSHRVSSSS